jgi:lipid-binding SYLF domain-containing protein
MKRLIFYGLIAGLLCPSSISVAGKILDKLAKGAESVTDTVSDTVKKIGGDETPEETREKIDKMSSDTLKRLFSDTPHAKKLYDISYGYAVFDTRKFSFMITTGTGAGMAQVRGEGDPIYMKMATGGVNIGLGTEIFQLVFLFEDEKSFDLFLDQGVEVGTSANAVLGEDGESMEVRFVDGVAVYQLTEKGLKLTADITGTKYWKDSDLNE